MKQVTITTQISDTRWQATLHFDTVQRSINGDIPTHSNGELIALIAALKLLMQTCHVTILTESLSMQYHINGAVQRLTTPELWDEFKTLESTHMIFARLVSDTPAPMPIVAGTGRNA